MIPQTQLTLTRAISRSCRRSLILWTYDPPSAFVGPMYQATPLRLHKHHATIATSGLLRSPPSIQQQAELNAFMCRFTHDRIVDISAKRKTLADNLTALERLAAYFTQPLVQERPIASKAHQLFAAAAANRVLGIERTSPAFPTDAHIFLVRHDWAAAFANAHDYADGHERLPFPVCCFEFQYSNRHICAIATQHDTDEAPVLAIYVQATGHWIAISPTTDDAPRQALYQHISANIRAAAIALEADVAEVMPITGENPHQVTSTDPAAGPFQIIHAICPLGRSRSAAAHSARDEPHSHRRLHFRRGHWRHYPTTKRWIRWTLVGNPDLGFIAKCYTL